METIGDIIDEIVKIRNAVDEIEVKGNKNATLVSFAYDQCNKLINSLVEVAQTTQKQNENKNQNEPQIIEVGEENGQQN